MNGVIIETEKKKINKTNTLTAAAYFVIAVLSFLFVFANLGTWGGVTYSIGTLADGAWVVNTGFAVALFTGSAVIMLLLAAATIALPFVKNGRAETATRLALLAAQGLLFAITYPPTVAALTQFLWRTDGGITVFLPFAYLLPLLPACVIVFEVSRRWQAIFKKGKKVKPFTLIYPLLLLLSAVSFALPLLTSPSNASMLTPLGLRSLHNVNGARAALLVIFGAALSFVALCVHMTEKLAKQRRAVGLRSAAQWGKAAVALTFAVVFAYCCAGLIIHFVNSFQWANDAGAGWRVGAGTFVMPLTALAMLAAFLADGIGTWQKIRPEKKQQGHFGMIASLLASFYVAFTVFLFLCVALPYGNIDIGGRTTSIYILLYKGVQNNMVESVVPSTSSLFGFALPILLLALISLAANLIWKKEFLLGNSKTAKTICVAVKPAIAVVVTVVFAAMYKQIALYETALSGALATNELASGLVFVPTALKVASIGLLVAVLLDVVLSLRAYFLTKK